MVEDIVTKHNLCILNDSSFTYIHPTTGSSSAIDLIWKRHKADWPSFSNEASKLLGCCNPDISLDEFSEKLITIAKNNIPKSKFSVREHNTVWYNDTCKEAINKRKKALRKVKSSPPSLHYIFTFLSLSHHCKALNSLICADVPLRNYSLTHSENIQEYKVTQQILSHL